MPHPSTPPLSGRERALEHLRLMLADPRIEGAFINEQDVAAEIGVSRTPVREALLILASEGLVQLQPRRGALVSPLTPREMSELMDLRALIEHHAAGRALAAGLSPHERMAEIVRDQDALTSGRVSLDPATARQCIELDREFHQTLVDAAGSALLSRTYAGLRERQVRVGVTALASGPRRWEAVSREHTEIIDALRSGDRVLIDRAIDEHLSRTLHAILSGA